MKTLDEKLEVCSKCQKREFSTERGLICSLSKEKPDFDEVCASFDPDNEIIAFQKSKDESYERSKSVSGWLAFFLWVGLGCGSALSLIMGITQVANANLGWMASLVVLILPLIIVVIAMYAIVAFYYRKSNAVALAKTYIAMTALDGVLGIIMSIAIKDSTMCPQGVRNLIWSAIWFTYLLESDRVADLIPKNIRTWRGFEKASLIIFVILEISFTALFVVFYKIAN